MARSVKELIGLARSKPGQLNYASAGTGSVPHLSAELFKLLAKIDLVHVPYKGSGPAITDLLGGQVSLFFDVSQRPTPLFLTVEPAKLLS